MGSAVFHRALASLAQDTIEITPEMVKKAEWISGLELSDEERNATASSLQRKLAGLAELRQLPITNDVAPAFTFRTIAPAPTQPQKIDRTPEVISNPDTKRPATDEEIAFLPVSALSRLIKNREVSSVELTKLYLSRLKKIQLSAELCRDVHRRVSHEASETC